MTTHQLRFGAYWDALPPFYTTQGLPPIQESNYDAFTKSGELMPVEMPLDLALKFLWQVRSVVLKVEYDFDEKTQDGWQLVVQKSSTDQVSALQTKQFTFDGLAISAITSRELRVPQGYMNFETEAYPSDRDDARAFAREGFGIINPFSASDYADFDTDKELLIPAIDEEAAKIKDKLLVIKEAATSAQYATLKTEIERQEVSFDAAVDELKQAYQTKLDQITAEYEASTQNSYAKVYFGKQVQDQKDKAVFDVKQEAQLQWFDWEGGFDRGVRFNGVGRYRVQNPLTLHSAPRMGGLFGGIYQTTAQKAALSSACMAVLNFDFVELKTLTFAVQKDFSYQRKVLVEPDPETTITIDSAYYAFCEIEIFKAISTEESRAAAKKLPVSGDAILYGGFYQLEPPSSTTYTETVLYNDLFNFFNQEVLDPLPPFPQSSNFPYPEIGSVVLSGEYFGGGSWDAAKTKFQELADKIREMKEVGTATENGTLEFRDKDDNLLFEAPIFVKDGIPIKNVRLTYKIKELYTDPPAGETGSA